MVEQYYYPIEKANTFINRICDKYDNTFQKIRVYGTNENPLFVARDVYMILNEIDDDKNLSKITKDYDIEEGEFTELIKNCPLMVYRDKDKTGTLSLMKSKVNVFTKYGVYRMMFSSKNKIAKVFRKFVYIVLKELEMKGEVKLIEAQEKLRNEMDMRHQKDLKKINTLSIINADLSRDAQEVQRLKELIHPDHLGEFDPDSSGLNVYEKQFGKKSIVYLVRDEYVNSEIFKLVVKSTSQKRRGRPRKNAIADEEELKSNDDVLDDPNTLIISSQSQFETEEDAIDVLGLINYEEQIGVPFEQLTLEYLRSIGYDGSQSLYLLISKPDGKMRDDNENFRPISEIYFANNNHYDAFLKEIEKSEGHLNVPGTKKIFNDIYRLPYEFILRTKNQILVQASLNIIELRPQKLRKRKGNDMQLELLEQSIREIEAN